GKDLLGIGPYWLQLVLPSGSIPGKPLDIAYSRFTRIDVSVDLKTMTITPGQTVACRLTLTNLGNIVDHLSIAVEGAPSKWVQVKSGEVQLNPGAKATVDLQINVPKTSSSHAGEYQVTIRALSRENPRDSGLAQVNWTVLPFVESSIDLTPSSAGGRTQAT